MKQDQIARQNLKFLRYQFLFWGWLPENVVLIIYFGELLNSYALSGVVLLLRYFFISFFEIPTGIISDKYGRRLSLIFSALCYSFVKISYILAFFCYPFVFLIISSVFYGLAESLSSGTNNAVVYENVNWLFHHYLVVWLPQCFQCTLLCGYLYLEHFYIYILVGGL